MSILLWVLAVGLVLVGLAGILVPALPGTILIFAGLLLAAWADDFSQVGTATLIVLGILAAASYTVDFVAAALGTRRLGASGRGVAGAAIGTAVGFFFGLPGIVLGPFVGAVLGELTAQRDLMRAGRAGVAAWIGFALGTAAKVGIAFLMIAIFVGAWVF